MDLQHLALRMPKSPWKWDQPPWPPMAVMMFWEEPGQDELLNMPPQCIDDIRPNRRVAVENPDTLYDALYRTKIDPSICMERQFQFTIESVLVGKPMEQLDKDVAKSYLSVIKTSAQHSIEENDYVGALWKYRHAIYIAEHHGLSKDLQHLRIECASTGLKIKGVDEIYGLEYAMHHATNGIALTPDCAELYFIRAEAIKRLPFVSKIPLPSNHGLLIQEYCMCFSANSERTDALVEAIVLAVDCGLTSYLPMLKKKHVSNGTAMKIVNELINKPSEVAKYLEHFIFKMHPDVSFSKCSISFCDFVKKGIIIESVLTRLLQIGIKITSKDIEDLIYILPEDKGIPVMELALAKCSDGFLDITPAASAAVTSKKFTFLSIMIMSINWTSLNQTILNYLIANGTPKNIAQLIMKGLKNDDLHGNASLDASAGPQLIDFHQHKCVVCSKEVIGEILKDDVFETNRTKLLCLLLNWGANSLDLCQDRFEKTTPLHAATSLALESGSTEIISAVVKCAGFKLPEDGRVIDENGDCPYHLVAKSNKKDYIKVTVCSALSHLCPALDPTVKDRPKPKKKTKKKVTQERMAKDYVSKEGEVYRCLVSAENIFAVNYLSIVNTSVGVQIGTTAVGYADKQNSIAEQHPRSDERHPFGVERNPIGAIGHPGSAERHPDGAEGHPVGAQGHPDSDKRHSCSAKEHPGSAKGYPDSAEGHPGSAEGHPGSADEHPVSADEHLDCTEGHTVNVERHPGGVEAHPGSAEGHLVGVEGHPDSADGHPDIVDGNHGSAKEHPGSAEEYPGSAKEHPDSAERHPVNVEGLLCSVERHSDSAKGYPDSAVGQIFGVEGNPGSAEGHLVGVERHPGSAEGHPGSVDGNYGSAEGHPDSAEGHHGSAKEHPDSAEGHHGSAKEHHDGAQGHPVNVEGHLCSVERHSDSAKNYHVGVEGNPGSAEGCPFGAQRHPDDTEGHPVGVERHRVNVEGHPGSVEAHPASAVGQIVGVEGNPGSAEGHLFGVEKHTGSAEGHPDSVDGNHGSAEGHPVNVEGHLCSVERHSDSAKGYPGSAKNYHVGVEGNPGSAEGCPFGAERHPDDTEGHPVSAKGHHVNVEGHPDSVEAHPASAVGQIVGVEGNPASTERHSDSAKGYPGSAEGYHVGVEGNPGGVNGHPDSAKGHPDSANEHPDSTEGHPGSAEGHRVGVEHHPNSAEGHAIAGHLSITSDDEINMSVMLDALLKRLNTSMLSQVHNSTVVPVVRNTFDFKDLTFDSYPWKVEITQKVYAFLKSMQPEPLCALLKYISVIAQRGMLEAETIPCDDDIKLFYKKLKGCHILLEKATQYSPSITEQHADSNYYYVQVIRVWDLSTACEDQLKMYIDQGIERVRISYSLSQSTNIGLFPVGDWSHLDLRTPTTFKVSRAVLDGHLCDVPTDASGSKQFLFACSRENGEYRTVPFYALSSELVHTLQADCCYRCDFPPTPWPVEDQIVSVDPAQTVLLFGRSGTGKTTCCLNRLWNQFKSFWDPHKDCDEESELRQIFMTKNHILRKQIKRKFYSYCASHECLKLHLEHEEIKLPLTLSEVKVHQYPLFITSREFILLLDRTLPGESYFGTKDPTILRIVNSDYDLDEDNNMVPEVCEKHVIWTEITAQYFVKMIWPLIVRKCHTGKELDPILVWMEINSFIKGSAEALQKNCPLQKNEYETLGKKLAPNYADERPIIYKLYEAYVHVCQNSSIPLFDECDLIHNVYKRLTMNKGLPCLPHCCYVDEVQDFTQGELMLILACCRDPSGHFFSGDTAQSIMSGVTIRFKDLRSIIRSVSGHTPDVHTLVVNFRSHDGIMQLAGSVIDLLKTFFKHSFDSMLPQDRGIMVGPHPILLSHESSMETIFPKMHGEDAQPVLFEFEAHQVVIVRSAEVKIRLLNTLSAIVLTVFEAKGLEFDDVLLYDFFRDSLVDKKMWKVIITYLDENPEKVVLNHRGTLKISPAVPFDPRLHKALESELKCLYTSVTRAKSKLWIYDSDEERHNPMYDYWLRRGVAKQADKGMTFSSTHFSTKEEWKERGDQFKQNQLYDQALHCYKKLGKEFEYLQKEMQAFKLIQENKSDPEQSHYMNAAVLLLEANELHNDVHYIKNAAACLMKVTPPKHNEAVQLYEKIGETELAIDVTKKVKDFMLCVQVMECHCRFREAVEVLDNAGMWEEALKQALKYENNDTKLADMGTECLAHKYARLYSTQKDVAMLETVLPYIPDHSAKAKYWRRCGQYEKAIEIYMEKNTFEHAFRLMSCLGWYDRGLELARKENDKKWVVNFAVEGAKASLHDHQALDTSVLERLEDLLRDREVSGHNTLLPIIYLVVGCGTRNIKYISQAIKIFKNQSNIIGELESYGQFFHLLKSTGKSPRNNKELVLKVLEAGCIAVQLASTLSDSIQLNDLTQSQLYVVRRGLDFYGITSMSAMYCFHPKQNVWLGDLKQCERVDSSEVLLNGMSRMDINKVRFVLAKRLNELGCHLLENAEIERKLGEEFKILTTCTLYSKIKDLLFQTFCISPDDLQQYTSLHINLLKYCYIVQQSTDGPIRQLLTLFSPNVSPHLPPGLLHLKLVRSSTLVCESIFRWLLDTFHHMKKTSSEKHKTDVWLMLWKASCIVGKGGEELRTLVKDLAQKVDTYSKIQNVDEIKTDKGDSNGDGNIQLNVAGFETLHSVRTCKPYRKNHKKTIIMDTKMNRDSYTEKSELKMNLFVPYDCTLGKYTHHFEFWLHSCFLIRHDGDVTAAAEFVIKYFLSHIAVTAKDGSQIMVMNVVEILSIHSTALLGVIMRSQHRLSGKAPVFVVPHLYESVIETFDELNTYGRGGYRLLEACVHQADLCPEDGLKKLSFKALQLLRQSLDLLLGVLKFALNTKLGVDVVSSHCLILVLTLVVNLTTLSPQDHTHLDRLDEIIGKANIMGCQYYFTGTYNIMSVNDWSSSVVNVIKTLTQQYCPNSPGLVHMSCDQGIQMHLIPNSSDFRNYLTLPIEERTHAEVDGHASETNLQSFEVSKPQNDYQNATDGGGDPLMVAMGYCCACNLHLERPQMKEHITTTAHRQKVKLLQEYNKMEKECLDLQQAIQHLQDGDHHGNQRAKQIHDMEVELEWKNSIFDDIRWGHPGKEVLKSSSRCEGEGGLAEFSSWLND